MRFFIGSYTRMGGPGAALCALDGDALRLLSADYLENATYVILNRRRDRLFAVSSASASGGPGGSVASYAFDGDRLRRLSRQDTLGESPCHLCLSSDERQLYETNYLSGSVSVFPVRPDGVLGACIQCIQHQGHGPNPARQTGPHTHQVSFLPGTELLCAVDLGIDAVMLYRRDPATGLLTFHGRLDVSPGLGPRHLVYGANGLAYLAHEVASQVSVLLLTPERQAVLQTLPTLPADWHGNSTAAAIRIRDGKVYVSNRGHDSLAVFTIGPDGLLTPEGIIQTGGAIPRDFWFLSDGRLLIAHQDSACDLCALDGSHIRTLASLDIRGCVCVLPLDDEEAVP